MRHSTSDEIGKTVRVAAHGQWAKGLTLVSIRTVKGRLFWVHPARCRVLLSTRSVTSAAYKNGYKMTAHALGVGCCIPSGKLAELTWSAGLRWLREQHGDAC